MAKNPFPKIKKRYKVIILLLIPFLLYWIYLSSLTYTYPDREEIDKRVNYLSRIINEPLDGNSAVVKLGYESSEFMLFSYAYSTYAFTNLICRDSSYIERLAPLIKGCIDKVLDNAVSSQYRIDQDLLQSDSIPDYSVLYLGHLNLMLGCYRLVTDDESYNQLNDCISASLFRRYDEKSFLCLESYPKAIWIPDNTVALASLKLHSHNVGSSFDAICDRWIKYAKKNFIESKTGVLYSTVDAYTGKAEEEPRGSMLGWSIMFIYQFDKEFALEQYKNYKNYFSDNLGAFRLFRERTDKRFSGNSDIDSGPIILGYSIPANEFALGPAVVSGDFKTAKQIERLIGLGASTIDVKNEIRYDVRFIDMNISPMAEALVLNSLTMIPWIDN